MIQLQILSKILATGSHNLIDENFLTSEYFVGYENEFNFIEEHFQKYGNIPDKETFLSHFLDDSGKPTIELVEVTESDRYLIDTLREEYLFTKSVPIIQQAAKLLKTDANAASEFLINSMQTLQPSYSIGGVDIIANSQDRLEQYKERKEHQEDWFFTTGFQELDDIIHGLQRVEEYMVILARTNQGKSWILEKICSHIWQIGFNVGYISPEMSEINIGYRFDTLTKNFSNTALSWGKDDLNVDEYETYIKDLSTNTNKFIVATPLHFQKRITVTKLKYFVQQYKLDLIAVDGITYLSDERAKRGDNKNTSLTNISEDLMALSMEIGVPVIVVCQANRTGVIQQEDEGTPELDSMRDSDGIAHNASKVISIHQKKNGVLEIGIKKQRNGAVGGKLLYNWNIDKGEFTFIPSMDDAEPRERTRQKVENVKKKFQDKEDVF